MPYRRSFRRPGYRRRSQPTLARRQGGTGATFSGSVGLIRHSVGSSFDLATREAVCTPLVNYDPTNYGTPVALDGSSTKVLANTIADEGSRVDFVRVNITITQSDTSKNNTVYIGTISTSFNEGQLSAALMTTNFKDFIASNAAGEMSASNTPQTYSVDEYTFKDIQQHNIRGLLTPQFQLYSGRVITMNQVIPLPRKNRRSQNGSFFGLVFMNNSGAGGSDVNIRIDRFFKEIPADVA